MKSRINTAIPVQVIAVESGDGANTAAGYVTVKPLICQTDSYGETLDPVELFHVPYSRIQGGVAALVIDPIPGDVGLAVFAQQDCSNVTQGIEKPVQAGSFRYFDMADGFYIGGFLNRVPSVFVEVMQSGQINITAPFKVLITSPETEITGDVYIHGDVEVGGDVMASGISLVHHRHTCPDGTTSEPM